MATRKPVPTYKEVVGALGTMLAEYAEITQLLDAFMSSPSEPTKDETRRQAASDRMRDRMQKIYERALDY